MKTMKEIMELTAQNSYKREFQDAISNRMSDAAHISDAMSSFTGAYYLPAYTEKKFRDSIIRNGIIRNLATVQKLYESSGSVIAHISDDHASFVGEGEQIPGFNAKDDFTSIKVKAHKIAALAKVSMEFAYDAGFDLEEYIAGRMGKSFARTEDKAFVSGTGTGEPTGILNDTAGAEVSAVVNALSYDDMIDLFFSLKPEYRKNAVWLMNDSTALSLRKLKDGGGNYLWDQGNDNILGRPVIISNEMPNAEAGMKPVVFGDMSSYRIIDRSPISFKPLHELFALKGQVGYVAYELLDGLLIRREAIKTIKIAGGANG